jgi:hypothetical protein
MDVPEKSCIAKMNSLLQLKNQFPIYDIDVLIHLLLVSDKKNNNTLAKEDHHHRHDD